MADANYIEYGVNKGLTKREKDIKARIDLAQKHAEEKKAAEQEAKKQADIKERQDRWAKKVAERDAMQGKADGGIIEHANELYDLYENYPAEFERAYNTFKGEATKIWDFWKDALGLRRGGHVGFKR